MATVIILAVDMSTVLPLLVLGPTAGYILAVVGRQGCVVTVAILILPLSAWPWNGHMGFGYLLCLAG